jgi:ATP-dependent protease ClpP protease subunit
MYHEISGGYVGKLTEIRENTEEMARLQKQYDEYVLSKTKLLKKDLDAVKKGKGEWYITPDEAKKLGIIDDVLPLTE